MSIQDKDEDDANNSDSLLWRSGLLLRSKALTGTLLNTVRACNILSSQCLPSLPQTWVHMHPHSQLHTRTREGRRAFGRVLNCVVLSDARLPPLPLSRSLSERARSSARISPRATVARAGVDPSDRGRGDWRCSVIPHRFRDFALFVSRQRTLGPRFGEWCSLREAAAADAG